MKKLKLFFFFLCTLNSVSSQNPHRIDSLKHQLAGVKTDIDRVFALAALGFEYRFSKPDTSLFFYQLALKLAQNIKFLKGESQELSNISFVYREKGDLTVALDYASKAKKIAEDNDFVKEQGYAYLRLGLVYYDLKAYSTALEFLRLAMKKNESIHFDFGLAIDYLIMGQINEETNNLDSAEYFLQKSYEKNTQYLFPNILKDLGNIQNKRGNKILALVHYKNALNAGFKNWDSRTISFIYADIAELYKQMNKPDSAIYFAQKGLSFGQESSSSKGILLSSNLLAELYDSCE